jgi:cell division protein FtsB
MADPTRERARRPSRSRPTARRGRPARAGTARRAGTEEGTASRAGFTGRAVVLAVAIASGMLALGLPFKVFVSQRHASGRLEQQTAAQQARVDALKVQQRTWQDPAYVAAQARERLHFVKPGETAYIVLGDPASATAVAPGAAPPTPRPASHDPWYTQLWHSVQLADAPPPVKTVQRAVQQAVGSPAIAPAR